ncbi:LysR family transcriptional regulator [Cytobacillus suaedae]|nr:LysR family transcriptional regulator [Cytobacillus suaedae]
MDLKILKTFITAAKNENFHETAEKLYIAQPTVTVHIKQLESLVGIELFERKGRNIFLTTAGKRFLPYAMEIIAKYESGIQDLENWRQGYDRKMTLAVSPLIAASVLPSLLRVFLKEHPTIEIECNVMESVHIAEAVQTGSVDLGLSRMKSNLSSIEIEKLYDDPVILIVPHDGGDLETAPPLDPEEVVFNNIIFSHNHPEYWDDLLFQLRQINQRARSMVVSQVNVTKRFIEEGLGISFLPSSTVKRELLEGRVLQVNMDSLSLPMASTYLLCKRKTEETELFTSYLKRYYP